MTMYNMSNHGRRQILDIGNRGRDFARGKASFPKLVERMEIGEMAEKYRGGRREEAAMEIRDAYLLNLV